MRKRSHLVFSLLCCICILVLSQSTRATTVVVPRDDEMVVESRAIVTGRVTGLSTGVDANTQLVYTYIRLEVNAVLKGQIARREIVLKELGGETPDHGTLIFGAPGFDLGHELLLFLNTWPDGALRVHQGILGKFDIARDSSTGRLFAERRLDDQNVSLMASSGNGTDRRELDEFMGLIANLIDTNQKRISQFERRFFSGVPVLAQPSEVRSVEVGDQISPQWALSNPGSPSRWFEPDSALPVVFYVNPAGAPSIANVQEDMEAAMNAWSNAGAGIRVIYGGTTSGCGIQVSDGANTISFNNCDGYFSPSQGCSGLIAVSGIVRYMPSQTKTIGGVRYGKALEANTAFNPYAICNFTNRCQLQEVTTHELGHTLGLGHTNDTTATMTALAHFDNRCSSIMQDDARGIAAIYPGGSGTGRLSIMTSDLPTANVNVDYTTNLEATGGSGAYHWAIVGGQMPPGLQLGMSGLLFGKAGVPGNFDFVAAVSDLSGNASQVSLTIVVRPPGLPPVLTGVEYRKKRVFVSGNDFQANATVYVDGDALSAAFNGATTLKTQKRKLQPGVHQVYVVNPDGKQSQTAELIVE